MFEYFGSPLSEQASHGIIAYLNVFEGICLLIFGLLLLLGHLGSRGGSILIIIVNLRTCAPTLYATDNYVLGRLFAVMILFNIFQRKRVG